MGMRFSVVQRGFASGKGSWSGKDAVCGAEVGDGGAAFIVFGGIGG